MKIKILPKNWKKLSKHEKKGLKGFYVGLLLGLILFFILILNVIASPYYGQIIDEIFIRSSFNSVANIWNDSDVVQSLAYLCSLNNDSIDEVNCVYEFIIDNVNWGLHDKHNNKLNKPKEIFSEVSCCRDVAVLMKSVLDNMNIENEYIFEPRHVYNVIYLENMTCTIDMTEEYYFCK